MLQLLLITLSLVSSRIALCDILYSGGVFGGGGYMTFRLDYGTVARLEIDNLWKVQDNIATAQDFAWFSWRPKDFHSIDALATFDQAVTGDTR
jgi:hypothetical protein